MYTKQNFEFFPKTKLYRRCSLKHLWVEDVRAKLHFTGTEGMVLIFLSIVDKNINLTTICFWSKNQLFLIEISNLRKMSILTKNQIWQNSQIWRTSQILQKMSKFPPAPPPPPILWMCYLIFSGPKWNLSKPKGNRLYNEIVTALDAELATSAASRCKHLM